MELSENQLKAINTFDGQVLVVSCPGSGKTTCIVKRAVAMVNSGIPADSLLHITFTKASADEMAARFFKECNKQTYFSTIHAFCYRVLAAKYGYQAKDILKQSEEWIFISTLVKDNGVSLNKIENYTKEIMSGISFVKNREIPLSDFAPDTCEKELFDKIYKRYEQHKKQQKKIDFDDMLIRFRDLLLRDASLLDWCQNRFKYITVDEFQDVNQIQADIIYMIAGPNGNLFIVGDDDQSIYGFRAAQSEIMLDFPKRFPECVRINLDTNYRSGKRIVKFAGNLIKNNKSRFDKDFKSIRETKGNIELIQSKNAKDQAKSVIENISNKGGEYDNTAVLFRTNNLAIPFAAELIKKEIPFYTTENVPGIHEDPIFYDIKTYWRLANGQDRPGDVQKILNRPSRYLKAELFRDCEFNKEQMIQRAKNLKTFMRSKIEDMFDDIARLKGKTPEEFMRALDLGMGYKKWLKNYAEYMNKDETELRQTFNYFCSEAKEYKTMEEWFKEADKFEMHLKRANKKRDKSGLCLSTFHGAKGLEWESVYIVNANEDITPYSKAESEEELEEERRMFYVAATRAKDNLYIYYIDPAKSKKQISRFIIEMGAKKVS